MHIPQQASYIPVTNRQDDQSPPRPQMRSPSELISARTRRFAKWSAICSFALGMAGQVAYHLLAQAGMARAPWPVTTIVSCLPVVVLGMGTALAHMLRTDAGATADPPATEPPDRPRPGPLPGPPRTRQDRPRTRPHQRHRWPCPVNPPGPQRPRNRTTTPRRPHPACPVPARPARLQSPGCRRRRGSTHPHDRPRGRAGRRHRRGSQGPARLRVLLGRDRLPARHHPAGRPPTVGLVQVVDLGATLGATRMNTLGMLRTHLDNGGGEPQVTDWSEQSRTPVRASTDLKAGGSSPSERARPQATCDHEPAPTVAKPLTLRTALRWRELGTHAPPGRQCGDGR
jgi:hypothetical protein